jgi:hypothetical protein
LVILAVCAYPACVDSYKINSVLALGGWAARSSVFFLTRSDWACDDPEKRDQGGALFERSEFAPTPVFPGQRRLPEAKRRDPDSRVAFSLLTFFWRSKRK